jgi:hypothetical protein
MVGGQGRALGVGVGKIHGEIRLSDGSALAKLFATCPGR